MKFEEVYVLADSIEKRKVLWDILKGFKQQIFIHEENEFVGDDEYKYLVFFGTDSYWNLLYSGSDLDTRSKISIDELIELLHAAKNEHRIGCETFTYKNGIYRSENMTFRRHRLIVIRDTMVMVGDFSLYVKGRSITLKDIDSLLELSGK